MPRPYLIPGIGTVANGGTGATTAAAARTSLGVAPGTDVASYAAHLLAARVAAGRAFPIQSGKWYSLSTSGGTQSTGVTMVANRLYYAPFYVVAGFTVDLMGVNVTTLGSGGLRLGIYDAAGTGGTPGALILDAGATTADASTTGGKQTAAISQALTAETIYYFALLAQNAVTIVTAVDGAGSFALFMDTLTDTTPVRGYHQTQTFASNLPTTASGLTANTNAPSIRVRAV